MDHIAINRFCAELSRIETQNRMNYILYNLSVESNTGGRSDAFSW